MSIRGKRNPAVTIVNVIVSLLLLNVTCPGAGATTANPIKEEYRACKLDQDCALVLLRCECMYCAREGDKESGVADAVNGKYSDQVKDFGKCSSAELKHCSMAGPCAMTGTSVPTCQAGKCTIVYKARTDN